MQKRQTSNIYSHRQPYLIEPFLKAFTKSTGIRTKVVFSPKGLAQRLLAEGPSSPADVVLTVDIGRLKAYSDKGLFRPVKSEILDKKIPEHLKSKAGSWFGFSKRTRVIAVSNKSEAASKIERFEDLASPDWKGKICSRPGSHVYNRALLSSIIAANGEEQALKWAQAIVENLPDDQEEMTDLRLKQFLLGSVKLLL